MNNTHMNAAFLTLLFAVHLVALTELIPRYHSYHDGT